MSRGAQIVVAVVWVVVLLVFWVDARQYVLNQQWLPQVIPYDFGVGVVATVVTVAVDRLLRHRR